MRVGGKECYRNSIRRETGQFSERSLNNVLSGARKGTCQDHVALSGDQESDNSVESQGGKACPRVRFREEKKISRTALDEGAKTGRSGAWDKHWARRKGKRMQ